ncbi:sel1 repeat family protein [Psychrobacter sp. HII-4]|uniref:sel1 repeat family protein n=1 Tax=Psychrobacter sp. HII-4 TaxID=1569264 RepID=UPI001918EA6C|nr:sel1 repeat family protein [Psychrobacter sp. HII-4]
MTNKIVTFAPITFLLLFNVTIAYAFSHTIAIESVARSEPVSIAQFGTLDSEKEITKLVRFLKSEDVERFQKECDNEHIAQSCYHYASYYDLIVEDHKKSYLYYKKAFDLGIKQAGYFVGALQINYPERFSAENRLSTDESIDYLEQAFEAGSPDATRFLMMIYRDPELNLTNYDKAEHYNKIAIEQNVRKSRVLLAYLYIDHIKDKSKINQSITLLNEDLMLEKNWESSMALFSIYLSPDEYGASLDDDIAKVLAYAYITNELRAGRHEEELNSVDKRFIAAMEKELRPEMLKQAKALYLEMMAQMNDAHQ